MRKIFWSLSDKEAEKTAEGIFLSNYFEMDGDGGVYENICRFNHSCWPNCAHSFHKERDRGEIRAVRWIAEGEELTVPYIDLRQPRLARLEELKEKYGFVCSCCVCERPNLESDRRRVALVRKDEEIGKAVEAINLLDDISGHSGVNQALAAAVEARSLGIRLIAEVLRLVDDEKLSGVDDSDARACASLSFLLAGHPTLQRHWRDRCVERFAISGTTSDAAALRMDLDGVLAREPKLPPIVFNRVD